MDNDFFRRFVRDDELGLWPDTMPWFDRGKHDAQFAQQEWTRRGISKREAAEKMRDVLLQLRARLDDPEKGEAAREFARGFLSIWD